MKNIKEKSRVWAPLGGVVAVTLGSFGLLTAQRVLADDIGVSVTIDVPSSCMMSSTPDAEHIATIVNGTRAEDIGSTTIRILCNNRSSYDVYAVGYTGDVVGDNNLRSSGGGVIATGDANGGAASSWAMKITPVGSGAGAPEVMNGFGSYRSIPSDPDTVAVQFNSSPDNGVGVVDGKVALDYVTDNSFKTTYAAYVAAGQAAGTYNGKVRYSMVHNAWTVKTMQGFSASDFAKMAVGVEEELVDTRTGDIYTVRMLSLDGTKTLWMMSNLKLPAGTTLKPADSNVRAEFTLPTEEWTSFGCRAMMKEVDGEYYYNAYAANANPHYCESDAYNISVEDDEESVGDVCPAGWRLPGEGDFIEEFTYNNDWMGDLLAGGRPFGVTGFINYAGTVVAAEGSDKGSFYATSVRSDYRFEEGGYSYMLVYSPEDSYRGEQFTVNQMGSRRYGLKVRCVKTM